MSPEASGGRISLGDEEETERRKTRRREEEKKRRRRDAMAPVEKESASGARSAAGSGSGSGSGEGRTFQYSRHLAVVAVGCLLLLARDFLNTKDGSQSGKAPVPTQSPNTVATTTASSGASGADAVVVNNNLDVPESQMKFLDTSSGKSAQRLFMEENSVGHRVHISYCQS